MNDSLNELELLNAAAIIVAGQDDLLELRVSAELACELGELAHKQGTTLRRVLEQHKCVLVVTNAPATERLASLVDDVRLAFPRNVKLAEDFEPVDLDALRLDAAQLAPCMEEPEIYEDKRPRCAKCKRLVSNGRRHCFPCALRR